MKLVEAGPGDAATIVSLRKSVAEDLTQRFGRGHWSRVVTEKGVLFSMRHSRVFMAKCNGDVLGVLRLAERKPWAINPEYFTAVSKPLYLTGIAVAPGRQGRGVGRWLLDRALEVARDCPADALRLDAYDAEAGAEGFYVRCGFNEVGRVRYRGTPLIYFEQVLAGPLST